MAVLHQLGGLPKTRRAKDRWMMEQYCKAHRRWEVVEEGSL